MLRYFVPLYFLTEIKLSSFYEKIKAMRPQKKSHCILFLILRMHFQMTFPMGSKKFIARKSCRNEMGQFPG